MPATWVPGPLLQTQEEHAAYLVAPNAAPLLLCYRPALVQAEELDARILGAIIAGVRRAFPFVAGDDVEPLVQRHSDALFRMVHTASFGVAVQALLLLFKLMSAQNSVSDRFYRWVEVTSLREQRSNKFVTHRTRARWSSWPLHRS